MKQVLTGLVALSMALSPAFANAACFTETEWRAAHVRVLQTDLMVAALECQNVAGHSLTDQYNAFVAKMNDSLVVEARRLTAHFQRVFGGSWGRELDAYVTQLANDASGRSLQDVAFCAHSQGIFRAALALDKPQLEQAAVDYVSDHSQIGDLCPAGGLVKRAETAAAGAR